VPSGRLSQQRAQLPRHTKTGPGRGGGDAKTKNIFISAVLLWRDKAQKVSETSEKVYT
jgi:hypothetical protein